MTFQALQATGSSISEEEYKPIGTDLEEWRRERELLGLSTELPLGEIIDYSDDLRVAGLISGSAPTTNE